MRGHEGSIRYKEERIKSVVNVENRRGIVYGGRGKVKILKSPRSQNIRLWILAALPVQSCELAGVWYCNEAGSLRKRRAGYLRKYLCLGGLKRKTLEEMKLSCGQRFVREGGPCIILCLFGVSFSVYIIPMRI